MSARAPWERQPGETDAAWRGFVVYRDLGPDRSIDEAYKRRYSNKTASRAAGHFTKWARDNAWVERARAFDAHKEELERAEMERVWAERAAEIAGETWSTAVKLDDKLRQMLELPLTEQQVKDGGRLVIIKPARWRLSDAVRIAQVVDELKRKATGQPTEHKRVTVDAGEGVPIHSVLAHLDLAKLSQEELDTLRELLERARKSPDEEPT